MKSIFSMQYLFICLAVVLGTLGSARVASASIVFHALLVSEYGWGGTCDLCHTEVTGTSEATATQPFAEKLKAQGIRVGASNDQLRTALEAILDGDTDLDGETDREEIANFGNPNDPTILSGGAEFEPVTYGCLRIAPSPSTPDGWGLLAAAIVAFSLYRRRR